MRKTFAKPAARAHHARICATPAPDDPAMSKPPREPEPADAPADEQAANPRDVGRADTQGLELDDVAPGQAPGFDAIAAVAELDAALTGEHAMADTDPGLSGTSDSYVALLEAETEELTALVAKKDERIAALEDEAERAKARIERAAEKELAQRTRTLVLGFIDVLDDLDRALTATHQGSDPAVREGMELVRKRFLAKLAELDVRPAPALGTRFDPNLHEAMSVVPAQDPEHDGMIMSVMREGYVMGEDILRPAGVVVAKLAQP
jgi:molecular chaperone GrpE